MKLKKGRITLVGTVEILFVVTFLFINNTSSKGGDSEVPSSINSKLQAENEKKYKEALEFQKYLEKENGLFEQVSNSLKAKGYSFRIMYSVFSKDDIKMKYILSDVTEFEKEEIKSIFLS